MSSTDLLIRGQHVLQLSLSLYGGAVSVGAIINLRKYEETAEKLAEWSSTAAKELQKTRTTQASGAVAIFASILASGTIALFSSSLTKWVRIGISPAMLVLVLLARGHIKNYWAPRDGKNITRIPLPRMQDYNEAERRTENLLKVLEYLQYSWVVSSLVNGRFRLPPDLDSVSGNQIHLPAKEASKSAPPLPRTIISAFILSYMKAMRNVRVWNEGLREAACDVVQDRKAW